jgi:hypothetical protein
MDSHSSRYFLRFNVDFPGGHQGAAGGGARSLAKSHTLAPNVIGHALTSALDRETGIGISVALSQRASSVQFSLLWMKFTLRVPFGAVGNGLPQETSGSLHAA